jgi:Tfp pilus assembly protein PilF
MGEPSLNHVGYRLDSWKEIAAFFGRDERTVRRWEKDNALPVHRVPGGAKARVFAYENELRVWLSAPPPVDPAKEATEPTVVSPLEAQSTHPSPDPIPVARWPLVLALCVLMGGIVFAYHSKHRFAANASVAVPSPPTDSSRSRQLEAHNFYLKGRYYWNKRTPDSLNKAIDYFTQAIVRDPNYAQAYVGLADTYNLLREYSGMPDSEAFPRALAAARKAVELDERSSEAHASLAFSLFYGNWDVANADKEFRRAIELDPSNAVARHWYATYLMTVHRLPESITEIERAQTLDPSSISILADKGLILLQAGRNDESVALLRQLEASEPNFLSPHRYLKQYYLDHADYQDFLVESKAVASLTQNKAALAIAEAAEEGYLTGGATEMFESILLAQKRLYDQGLVTAFDLAHTYARVGNREETMRLLNAAFDQHDVSLFFLATTPEFEALHSDPAYRSLADRIGFQIKN